MAEEIKEKVFEFLRERAGNKFTQKSLHKAMREHMKISYHTISKWIAVLEAEKRIKTEDYGNFKVVYYE